MNHIRCSRACNISQDFYVIKSNELHEENKPYLLVVHLYYRARLAKPEYKGVESDPEIRIDETIPGVGQNFLWGDRVQYASKLRAAVYYRDQLQFYLLEDSVGWPWIEVMELIPA
jgi:hypothetical protein